MFYEAAVAVRGEAHKLKACIELVRNYLVTNNRKLFKLASVKEGKLL